MGKSKIIVGVVLTIIILVIASIVGAAIVILPAIKPKQSLISPQFGLEILETNDKLGGEWKYERFEPNYTVYARIRNNLVSGWVTVYCEITREDLSTLEKSQSVYLQIGETKVVEFFFSNDDLGGYYPRSYRVFGED